MKTIGGVIQCAVSGFTSFTPTYSGCGASGFVSSTRLGWLSSEFLGKPDEDPLDAADVAEPVDVLVLNDFVDE